MVDGGNSMWTWWNRKPPLLFWTYAAIFKVAGKSNWIALHCAALLWTLGTMAGLYVIGARLFDRRTGFIAALFYSVFQPWGSFKNLAFNGELLMNLPWSGRGPLLSNAVHLDGGRSYCWLAPFYVWHSYLTASRNRGGFDRNLLAPPNLFQESWDKWQKSSIAHAAMLTTGFLSPWLCL